MLITLLLFIFPHHSLPAPAEPCKAVLETMASESSSIFSTKKKTLTIGFPSTVPCQSIVIVELWIATSRYEQQRPRLFGTQEYFKINQNCESPNPDFWFLHGRTIHTMANKQEVIFHHIRSMVEYMLRICLCSKPLHSPCLCSSSPVLCQHQVVTPKPMLEQLIMYKEDQGLVPTHVVLDRPVIQDCPAQVSIPGTVPASTLHNGYEKVEVILETMAKGETTCQYQTSRSEVQKKVVSIHLLNATHGSLSATFENIEYKTAYCLRVSVGE
jgi:hypothetical protein